MHRIAVVCDERARDKLTVTVASVVPESPSAALSGDMLIDSVGGGVWAVVSGARPASSHTHSSTGTKAWRSRCTANRATKAQLPLNRAATREAVGNASKSEDE